MSLRRGSAYWPFGSILRRSAIGAVVLSHDALVRNAHCLDSYPRAAAMQQFDEDRPEGAPSGMRK